MKKILFAAAVVVALAQTCVLGSKNPEFSSSGVVFNTSEDETLTSVEIEESQFSGTITIPSRIKSIAQYCFSNCKSLCEIKFEAGSKLQRIEAGAFYLTALKTIQIPSSVLSIDGNCFGYCKSLYEVTFEAGSKLEEIGNMAFSNTGLKTIQIPSSVLYIGKRCFSGCESLVELIFEAGVFEQISCSDNVTVLDPECKRGELGVNERTRIISLGKNTERKEKICSLREGTLIIEENKQKEVTLRSIKVEAAKKLKSIEILAEVSHINKDCFLLCQLLCKVTFESGSKLQLIEKNTFSWTNLKEIKIPPSVEFIGEQCFCNCNLWKITFERGSKLKQIEEYAFSKSALEQIEIPSSVLSIGENCFYLCKSLREITFESGSEFVKSMSQGKADVLERIRNRLVEKENKKVTIKVAKE
jgi:hypothetical protein